MKLGAIAAVAVAAMGAPALTSGADAITTLADPGAQTAPPGGQTGAEAKAVLLGGPTDEGTLPAFAPPGPAERERAVVSADRALSSRADALHLGARERLGRPVATSGTRGLQYLTYPRTYQGLPVYGGDVIVLADRTGGVVHAVTTGQQTALDAVGTEARVSAVAASSAARAELPVVERASTPRLLVHATTERPRLAWEVIVTGQTRERSPSVLHVFVDALDGTVFDSYDQVRFGTGNSRFNGSAVTIQTSGSPGSYAMRDLTRPELRCGGQNGSVYTKAVDTWGNGSGTNLETACVDVLFAAQKQWDMLRNWLGRNGIDSAGHSFPARVGLNDVNNVWNGSALSFGHNSANTKQLTSLDMVGHEYGHAVFEYSGSSGGPASGPEGAGLAESAGDILGTLTEHYANEPPGLDVPDYLIGEEVDMWGSGPIRNMYNPALLGGQNCYRTGVSDPGPQNHWFYLLAEGTNPPGGPVSPVCSGPGSLTGVGIRKAGQIFYGGLQLKTSSPTHGRARVATLQATKALFVGCTEFNATKAAWSAVNVPAQAGEPTCP
ncbi:M4 family metallopeptidase [Streptosporangium sp. NPDC051022]|uniref:M4 family metallopeptidase n=1 Tax=Streptosporangium sp. NPDC051022 TaxID=3155752 RepID=UPI0034376594